MRFLQAIAQNLAKIEYVRCAINDCADLRVFRQKPTPKSIVGIGIILLSYAIGWPLVGVLGIVAFYIKEPLIFVIGGPAVYGFSHLVFIVGMYLAGKQYAAAFTRWLVRKTILKMMGGRDSRSSS